MRSARLPKNDPGRGNAIYAGTVAHHRSVGRRHSFKYSLFMLYLDIRDVDDPTHSWPLISRGAFSFISVVASDYLAASGGQSLRERLRRVVRERTGEDWDGEGYLLAHPRYFGFIMNPLALYYLFDSAGNPRFVVGEITNTPWGERHCYVFDFNGLVAGAVKSFDFQKVFHVSPFLPMNMSYVWRLAFPGQSVSVSILNQTAGKTDFSASLALSHRELSAWGVLSCAMRMPLMTFQVMLGIYWHAFILYFIKRVTFYEHPKFKKGVG